MKNKSTCVFGARSVQAVRRALVGTAVTLTILAGVANAQSSADNQAATDAQSQTSPQKKVEFGVGGVSDSSFKFGEYNGLQNDGPFGIASFNLRGGAAYDSKSTWRWSFQGRNLGLENRNISAEFGHQGKFLFRFAYDEIIANRSNTFQTPYLGIGTNNLTLPSNWVKPIVPQLSASSLNLRALSPSASRGSVYSSAGVLTAPTAAQLATLASIVANDVPAFQNVNLGTKRIRGDAAFLYSPSQHWDIGSSYSREHKEGRKALGAVTSQVNENAIILPYLVDWDTDQANVTVNYKLKKLYLSLGYYGSFFHNNVNSMTWQDVANSSKSATLAEEPSNQMNQFLVTAAYKLSPTAKLVMTGSYGRNTQDDAFLGSSTAANGQLAFGLPRTSLNGLVVTGTFTSKLTAKVGKKWDFLAAYKFDDRDNQTPVSTYLFQDANESKSGTSPFAGLSGLPTTIGSNTNIYNNRAYSRMINQVNLQAEYAPVKGQYVQTGFDWERIHRSCSGAWINCADAPTVNEGTIRAEWRKTAGRFKAKAAYAFALRRGDYDENAFLALVPMANVTPAGGASTSVYSYLRQNGLTGFGPQAGIANAATTGDASIFSPSNNAVPQSLYGSRNAINELLGLRRYYVADRNQNRIRTDLEWQATQKVSLQGTGELKDDDYQSSKFGLRRGTFWTASMDASYAPSENLVADIFYTYDNQRYSSFGDAYGSNSTTAFQGRAGDTVVSSGCYATVAAKNANAKIDPCLIWHKNNRDKIDSAGLTISRKNLLGGKLELADEVLYTRARTTTAVSGGSYVNNPLALAGAPVLSSSTPAIFYISASDYPVVRNDEISVRPSAKYNISKSATLQGFYWFQRLMATDWTYLGQQYGTGTNYLPTNEKVPSYAVHVAGMSLTYSF